MYNASQRFLAAMSDSHEVRSRLDVERVETTSLAVIDGTVTIDYDTPTRRSLDVTIIDPDRTFGELDELLEPLLAILHPYRGVGYSDGTEELLPLGVFYPEKLDVADAPGTTFKMSAFDASTRCQGGLDQPFNIAGGSDFDLVVPQLLARKMPSLEYRLAKTPYKTPTLSLRGQVNPWTKAQELYVAVGFDLSIARDGVCESQPRLVSATDAPVWEFVEGANATFRGVTRSSGAEDFPNVVVVTGTNSATGTAVRGEAADEDPDSETYRGGPTGERILEIESEKVTTDEQAAAMARLTLARQLGPQEQVTFSAVPNAALDVPDVVSITRESLGLRDRHMILSQIRLPLSGGEMQCTARRSILTDAAGVPVRV